MALAADNGLTFPQKQNAKGFMEFTDDIEILVKASIHQILGTRIGERVMEVEFGSRLYELLFEPIDDITIALARVYTIEAIERWEPRVELNDVGARVNVDNGLIEIYGSYIIVNKNIEDAFQVTIPRLAA